jgi:hypothetical protein
MTTWFVGGNFPPDWGWSADERELISSVRNQIDQTFDQGGNLLINSTWFGPQFDNGLWQKYKKIIASHDISRMFVIAAADPVFLNHEQLSSMRDEINGEMFLLGHFDTEYYFNFHSQVVAKYFDRRPITDVLMRDPCYLYLNYNRKPRNHRNSFVNKLLENKLNTIGIVTLGQYDAVFATEVIPKMYLTLGETADQVSAWPGTYPDFGIVKDGHSLGRLDIWQNHFLNIVGETEFLPWDNMFISEKTWKPILGLRPFVINGQQKIYQYLRDEGFKTFNDYWSWIDIENGDVHDTIIELIKYLQSLPKSQLVSMYTSMLPDLLHNREHFDVYANRQKQKISNLFNTCKLS